MLSRNLLAGLAIALAGTLAAPTSADAKCTRLGFSVNDYGKAGPARDAQNLLDKYIADWATKNNIKGYRTGKKDVKCELFLDFGFFDEYTCRAEATVCWGDNQPAGGAEAAATPPKNFAPAKKVEAAPKKPSDGTAAATPAAAPAAKKPLETGSVPAKKPTAPAAAAPKADPAAPLQAPAPAKKKSDQQG